MRDNPFRQETIHGGSYEYLPLGEYIVRAPGICGGRPTFKYTRIEITGAFERLVAGDKLEDIVSGYRDRVPKEAILEAVRLITSQFIDSLPRLEPA